MKAPLKLSYYMHIRTLIIYCSSDYTNPKYQNNTYLSLTNIFAKKAIINDNG